MKQHGIYRDKMCVYDEHPGAGGDNNRLMTYYQPVCYFLKNTTIPFEYYLQYPVNTTYNILVTLWKVWATQKNKNVSVQ